MSNFAYITVPQAAQLLGVTTRRVQRMITEEGKFPGARKLNPDVPTSDYLIPRKEVEAEIKRRAQSPSQDG
jgi:predicted DNA-binding transcriptional regulator AlpA